METFFDFVSLFCHLIRFVSFILCLMKTMAKNHVYGDRQMKVLNKKIVSLYFASYIFLKRDCLLLVLWRVHPRLAGPPLPLGPPQSLLTFLCTPAAQGRAWHSPLGKLPPSEMTGQVISDKQLQSPFSTYPYKLHIKIQSVCPYFL